MLLRGACKLWQRAVVLVQKRGMIVFHIDGWGIKPTTDHVFGITLIIIENHRHTDKVSVASALATDLIWAPTQPCIKQRKRELLVECTIILLVIVKLTWRAPGWAFPPCAGRWRAHHLGCISLKRRGNCCLAWSLGVQPVQTKKSMRHWPGASSNQALEFIFD